MAHLVITVLGDDRAGLVEAVSGAIARHDGNWDRSHMAELSGKFAGIVLASVPDSKADALRADLDAIEGSGLLDISVEVAAEPADEAEVATFTLHLTGQDHPSIVHDISRELARHDVSIDELQTEIVQAPMGGHLFEARAVLEAPATFTLDQLQAALESVAQDLMVDLVVGDALP